MGAEVLEGGAEGVEVVGQGDEVEEGGQLGLGVGVVQGGGPGEAGGEGVDYPFVKDLIDYVDCGG